MFYVYIKGEKKAIQCYDLSNEWNITEDEIDNVFEEIANIFHKEFTDKECVYTFILYSNGKVDTYMNYPDNYMTRKEWKKKYLNENSNLINII